MKTKIVSLSIVLSLFALLTAGCESGTGGGGGETSPSPAETTSPTTSPS